MKNGNTLCAMKMDYFDDLFGPSVESVLCLVTGATWMAENVTW